MCEPLWSLALNSERNYLSIGERLGKIFLLDIENYFKEVISSNSRLPKRMKWITKDRLLVGRSSNVDNIQLTEDGWENEEGFITLSYNTFEDFIFIDNGRVLVAITYGRYIKICDLASGE